MPITPAAIKKSTRLCILFGVGMTWLSAVQAGAPLVANQSEAAQQTTAASNGAAATQDSRARHPLGDWPAVSERELDDMRGGFAMDAGLKISFGIQRAVYVNGNLTTATSVNIPNLGTLTGEQATLLSATTGTVNLIQNGPANTFQPGLIAQGATATVIQNTLDNQNIKSLTSIDATVNSLGIFKGINFQSGLQDAVQHAVGGR